MLNWNTNFLNLNSWCWTSFLLFDYIKCYRAISCNLLWKKINKVVREDRLLINFILFFIIRSINFVVLFDGLIFVGSASRFTAINIIFSYYYMQIIIQSLDIINSTSNHSSNNKHTLLIYMLFFISSVVTKIIKNELKSWTFINNTYLIIKIY